MSGDGTPPKKLPPGKPRPGDLPLHQPPHDLPKHDEASLAQIRAADPRHSAWVMANAGSGKTRVLIDRVALLLLGGTPPQRILCLTYTKAAAAEMAERLFDRLGRWAMLEDGPLTEALARLHEAPQALDAAMLGRARRLFAQALETPGGLKIQTIHAFCDALLRRFPLEAGVAPGFFELDARRAAGLLGEIRNGLAAAAEAGMNPVFDDLAGRLGDEALEGLTGAILKDRALYPAWVDRPALAAALGVDPQAGPADWRAMALGGMPAERLRGMAAALSAGGVNDQAAAKAIALALEIGVAVQTKGAGQTTGAGPGHAPEARAVQVLAALEAAFLTDKGMLRSDRGFPSKAARALRPGLREEMAQMGAAVLAARDARLGAAALDRAEILHRFARALIGAYEAAKARAGALDFEDLIERSRQLLTQSDMRAWVLWKLDGGIDHILVDEAQDTSPAQWQVVAALAEEALSGAGARTLDRTVFAVGDMKQSIYSFQGARPRAFLEMRDRFDRALTALGSQLRQTPLRHSFRSASPILRLVDACFRGGASDGLSSDARPHRHAHGRSDGTPLPEHLAFFERLPGRVELWPFLPKPDAPAPRPWWQPLDAPEPGDPKARLAAVLADEIAGWLAAGRAVAAGPPGEALRAMRPGDILILVQRRDLLARELVRCLKARGVPVAGADRIRLSAELAVRDILAVLRFLDTPEDDLSLAAALRSPLFGLSEDALFTLAHGREGLLWQALRQAGHPAAETLHDLRDAADFLRPHELIDRLLTQHGGRRRLLARLGEEAGEAIETLMSLALTHEAGEIPGLSGFLAWIDADADEIHREPDLERADLVRVMTVHGAKGLEAPVVILPDTAARRPPERDPVLPVGGIGLWSGPAGSNPPALEEARAARARDGEEERRRLLYVALTRAKSLLIIAGAGPADKADGGWYGQVRGAMLAEGARPEPGPAALDGQALVLGMARSTISGPTASTAPSTAPSTGPSMAPSTDPSTDSSTDPGTGLSMAEPPPAAQEPGAAPASPVLDAPDLAPRDLEAPDPTSAEGSARSISQRGDGASWDDGHPDGHPDGNRDGDQAGDQDSRKEEDGDEEGDADKDRDEGGDRDKGGDNDGHKGGADPAPAFLSPSKLGGAHALAPGAAVSASSAASTSSAPPADADADAGGAVDGRALGDAVHALLERLPAIAPAERAAAAHAIASDALGAQAAELALRVLAAPEAGWIFGPDSLAEVDLSAELAALGGGAILGRVDRLIVAPQTVTAVDLKTNAQVPPHAQAVPEGILRQMGAYQAALERVFPDRRVDVALLWAGAADPAHMLMRLPRDLVLAALRRAGAVVAR